MESKKLLVISEASFRYGWRLLCATWRKNGHCLRLGCGRETLAYWVLQTCHKHHPAWFYRNVLLEACVRGWARKEKSSCGYSVFILNA